ncbi:SDR family oxidoreductase [Streptomyces sp. SCUT-3]|uniref:SDR family NAD(P)-dependent oxidoreductase n=1 Tax=Streptomyces TaxID=1883 RepID=UPI000CC59AC1|nr:MULTISPECIES: SDR family oxidoreductase [unclassified Streptomyces]MCZ2523286.1 SDR family oxidoreductase [Streptomyces sp. HB2AG]PLW66177.1 oxidoreductase [Streptomyces sp. DJ]QMV23330.1 SDR family oxidoreductase [Streptomyces sp. SCUT-3]
MIEASGRNVVVTGGGTGIGRAVAARFAALGDHVTIIGRRRDVLQGAAEELRADGAADVVPLVCDLADPDDVEAVLARLPERIDVLVNAAGSRELAVGAGPHGVLARWRGDFERNVLTVVLLTEAARDRITPDGGRVVTVTSVAALRGAGSYGAAKAALHAWNHSLAAQLGPQGITANVVAPGTVAGTDFFGARLDEAELTRRAGRTLVGRVGRPDEVASAVVFLASSEAGFITGEILHCNGGEMLGR